MNKNKKVVVGISGGVDSAVSAFLLKKQGYDVLGVYLWCYGSRDPKCRAHKDRADAVRVASFLEIPFEVWDFEKEYNKKVLDYFYEEYQEGRTPNPDVVCNKEIKFGLFYNKALKLGYDYVATGHYARIDQGKNLNLEIFKKSQNLLLSGKDKKKDQSYFLYRLEENQLKHILFPIGELKKEEVRKIAKIEKLPVWNKPDSQGICFVGEVPIREFLKGKINYEIGNVVTTTGEVIGKHTGLPFYTIGQRHGFSIDKYQGLPLYVIGKNSARNELIVGSGSETEISEFEVSTINWLINDFNSLLDNKMLKKLKVRIRHLGELLPCTLEIKKSTKIAVCRLSIPQRGVAPGQSAVFYLDNVVLGGGVIL